MSKLARTIHINAPAADVWAVLMDVERWPSWASQFEGIERIDAGPLAAGSRVRVRMKGMLASVWRVTEFDDGRSFTWASSPAPGTVMTGGHVLTADAQGTNAEFSLEASGPLGRLVSPLLRPTLFSRNTTRATEGLKRHVEGPVQSSRGG